VRLPEAASSYQQMVPFGGQDGHVDAAGRTGRQDAVEPRQPVECPPGGRPIGRGVDRPVKRPPDAVDQAGEGGPVDRTVLVEEADDELLRAGVAQVPDEAFQRRPVPGPEVRPLPEHDPHRKAHRRPDPLDRRRGRAQPADLEVAAQLDAIGTAAFGRAGVLGVEGDDFQHGHNVRALNRTRSPPIEASVTRGALRLTLSGTAVAVLLGFALLALYPITHVGSPAIGHLNGGLSLTLTTATIHLMCAQTELDRAARRFWRRLEAGMGLMGVGFLLAGFSLTSKPIPLDVTPQFPAYVMLPLVVGVSVYLWALVWLPVGARNRMDRVRLAVDGVTAVLGGAAIVWYFGVHPVLAHDGSQTFSALGMLGSCVPAAVLVIKVFLNNGGPVERRALRLLAWSAVCATVSGTLLAVVPYTMAKLTSSLVLLPLSGTLVAAAAYYQLTGSPAGSINRPKPRILPYLAVFTVIGLLLRVAVDPIGWGGRIVILAAVAIIALVVLQQFLAIRENTSLLRNLRGQEERLHHEATHDSLTGLANRALFDERLRAAASGSHPVGVLLIDLDDFKTVNDTLGHGTGNDLLIAFADIVRGAIRADDLAARLGGDEFAVLLTGDVSDAVAHRLLEALQAPVTAGGHQLVVKASIGGAVAQPHDGPEDLLRHADVAMYEAKSRGKAGYVHYSPGMEEPVLAHMQVGSELHRALERGEFFLVYQPIIMFEEDRIVGVEALVRWRHPTRGIVPPTEFIPAAERTGLIVPLGRWVIREAARQLAVWRREHGSAAPRRVACNVSARQLHDPGLAADVAAALEDARLGPESLVLELTESAALRGQRVLETLYDLDGRGFKLALDDFGTGESSLSLLRSIPVSVIKLDKSFVEGIEAATPAGQAVARAVVQLAASLELEGVAEGVENPEQIRLLREFGYQLGQGYHFSKPLTAEQFGQLLTETGGFVRSSLALLRGRSG
jgi:diguanylate cyclase (GGDEF)-like protein